MTRWVGGKEEGTEKEAKHQPDYRANHYHGNYLDNLHGGFTKPLPIMNNSFHRDNCRLQAITRFEPQVPFCA